MKKISFIIPVYNVEEYLEKCIKSVLEIKYTNKEIILINDGSTDNSGEICKYYQEKYENILLIEKENGGLSETRNYGLDYATGDYILFIDSDDFYDFDFTKNIKEVIGKNQDVILFKYFYYYMSTGEKKYPERNFDHEIFQNKNGAEIVELILESEPNFNWNAIQGIFKRKFLMDNNLYFQVGRNYEDMLWLPEVLLKAKKVDYIDDYFYVYRLNRNGQITATHSQKNFIDSIYVVEYWIKKIEQEKINRKLKSKLISNFINRYYYTIIYYHFLSYTEKKDVKRLISQNKVFFEYETSLKNKIIALLYKTFGLEITSFLTYIIIKFMK